MGYWDRKNRGGAKHVNQFCNGNELWHGYSCMNWFTLCFSGCMASSVGLLWVYSSDGTVPLKDVARVYIMECKSQIWDVPPDQTPVFFEPCLEKTTYLSSVGSTTAQARGLLGEVTSLQSWDGVLKVHQVGSKRRMGLVGNLDIVSIEPPGYWLANHT